MNLPMMSVDLKPFHFVIQLDVMNLYAGLHEK